MGDYINVKEIFGCDVFNDSVMQDRLPKKVYRELKKTIEEGKELSMEIADVVAHEMKEWVEDGRLSATISFAIQRLAGSSVGTSGSNRSAFEPTCSRSVLLEYGS